MNETKAITKKPFNTLFEKTRTGNKIIVAGGVYDEFDIDDELIISSGWTLAEFNSVLLKSGGGTLGE